MITRMFNDNGCETPNDLGNEVGTAVREALKPLIKDAADCKMSLRDFQTIVLEEVSLLCAETRLIQGIKQRKAEREAKRNIECGCPGVCSETDGNPGESK